MTEQQKQLVREALQAALGTDPKQHTALAHRFYERLFTVAPQVRPLFHSPLAEQEAKFTQMLVILLESLDRLDNLVPALWQSGRNHRLYGAEPGHYVVVGEVLTQTLVEAVGEEKVTPELREAWRTFYQMIALIMQEAARQP